MSKSLFFDFVRVGENKYFLKRENIKETVFRTKNMCARSRRNDTDLLYGRRETSGENVSKRTV